MNYLYANGVASALENSLIKKDVFLKLSSASNFDEFMEILQGTSYASKTLESSIEDALTKEKQSLFDFIKNECPDLALAQLFILPQDYDNIEAVVKCKMRGFAENSYLEIKGFYDFDFISNAIKNKDYKCFKNPFILQMLQHYNTLSSNQLLTPMQIDALFQKYKFKNLKNLFSKGILKDFVNFVLDIENLSIATRTKQGEDLQNLLVEFGTLNFATLSNIATYQEIKLDDKFVPFLELLRSGKMEDFAKFEKIKRKAFLDFFLSDFDSFSPSTFVRFVLKKMFEIDNLQLITNLQKNGLSDKIKSRIIEYS